MLLLFDIDGTLLLRASGEHGAALREAIGAVHGIPAPQHDVAMAGRTDAAIARSLLMLAGVDARRIDPGMDAVRERTAAAYARRCPADLSATVSPGMPEALGALARAGHVLSLVTGNFEAVARRKLARAGIGHWFAAGQGGFGSDHEDRAALPAVARRRAGAPGGSMAREETVVIGDTPLDVACARADGVRCAAIATGPFAADALREADVVLGAASELPGAIAALSAATRRAR